MASISKYEQETIINFNEADKEANVYTHNKATISVMEDYCANGFAELLREHPDGGREYVVFDKKMVKWKRPRSYTEEERAALASRFKTNSSMQQ